METSSLRGAFSFKALRNFLTSFIYWLCRCVKYSVRLFFILHKFPRYSNFQYYYKPYTTSKFCGMPVENTKKADRGVAGAQTIFNNRL